jgi:ectoine hydroxylase-related dioxygenase (phytanoyl-CoA dioxygenase family)
MNIQTAVMMNDFTVENGATGLIPYTQLEAQWPDNDKWPEQRIQITGTAGSTLIFPGLIHHASMENNS